MMKNIFPKDNKNSGFVLLFSIILSVVILALALGISNVAFRENTFATSAKETNNSFYAADIGVECALFYDLKPVQGSSGPVFPFGEPEANVTTTCSGNFIGLNNGDPVTPTSPPWEFIVLGLGDIGKACAKVSLDKEDIGTPSESTQIISRGYNEGDALCESTNPNRIERVLEVNY